MFLFRRQSRDSSPPHSNHTPHRDNQRRRSSGYLSSPTSPDPRCGLCEVSSLEPVVTQCPLSRSKLQELCEHFVHGSSEINTAGRDKMTLLHFAVLKGDEPTTRALLAFGADINSTNEFNQTPLDIATQNQVNSLIPLLVSCGCESAETVCQARSALARYLSPLPSLECSPASETALKVLTTIPPSTTQDHAASRRHLAVEHTDSPAAQHTSKHPDQLATEIAQAIERRFELSASLQPDEALAIVKQQKELLRMRARCFSPESPLPWATALPMATGLAGGCRVLSLDGGGIRGLIQIEVLSELERRTGRRVTELFDWVIGTSTGGIIALAMVYCKRPISYLRALYFKMKNQVFARTRMGYAFNTAAMEDILKEEFGTEMNMMDVTHPKVLVSAVDKSTVQPKLCFFNNCFRDEFSTQPVWKVARYTSAAPLYFTECDNFVDGGMLANNPSDTGLTRIQQHYQGRGERLNVACVVSIGSGVSPSETLGCVGPDLNLRSILNIGDTWRRTTNLIKLLSHALGESEEVARKCRCTCEGQGIPFYRLSPQLDEKIDPGETDTKKLMEMIVKTKIYTHSDPQTSKLIPLLLRLLPEEDLDDLTCTL